jgi:hypothetical protein
MKKLMAAFAALNDKEKLVYLQAFPNSICAKFLDDLKEGAYRKHTKTPKGKKIPLEQIKKDEHSENPLTRKRAQFAENERHWNHKGRKKS